MKRPLLSVALIVYDHEQFLEDAFEGIFMQQVDFDYEVVVSNDCSTDNSQAIIDLWKAKHPETIRLIDNPTNLGMHKNWEKCMRTCSGKYVALLEGDDAWISPNKLKLQVDFLEKNPDFGMTATNAKVELVGQSAQHPDYADHSEGKYGIPDLLENQFIPTCSVIFRAEWLPKNFPKYYYTSPMVDYLVHLMILQKGPMYYFNQVTSVYRLHGSGEWGQLNSLGRLQHQYKGLVMAERLLDDQPHQKLATKYKKDKLFQIATHFKDNGAFVKYLIYRLRTRLAI